MAVIDEMDLGLHSKQAMSRYANEVNLDRAIPDASDGLKPVQRRIILGMYRQKLFSNAKFKKVTKVVGEVMGSYHPHGDASIESALVGMSHEWASILPPIEIHGNNGLITGEGSAAGRYIETRMSECAELLAYDLNKRPVPFIDNYDGTTDEPIVLPARIPYILIGATSGMGYAASSNILPHNPLELLKASKKLAKKDLSDDELGKIIQGPDFATGGMVENNHEVRNVEFNDGSGSYHIRGTADLDYKNHKIIITSIPPVAWGRILYVLNNMVFKNEESKKTLNQFVPFMAKHIVDIKDHTASRNMDLKSWQVYCEIIFDKKTTDHMLDMFYQTICDKTEFDTKMSSNNAVIADGRLKKLGTRDILKHWINHRIKVLRNVLNYDKTQLLKEVAKLNAQIWVFDYLQDILKLARESKDRKKLSEDILKLLKKDHEDATSEQSDYIAGMALYRIGKGNQKAVITKRNELQKQINEIDNHLSTEDNMIEYFIKDVDETIDILKKSDMDVKRRTKVKDFPARIDTTEMWEVKNAIPSEETYVVVRFDGGISRSASRKYNNSIEEAHQMDDGKYVVFDGKTNTNKWLYMLTDKGQVMTRLIQELPDERPVDPSPLNMHQEIGDFATDDVLINAVTSDNKDDYIFTLSNFGRGKLVKVSSFIPNTNTNRYRNRVTWYMGLKFFNQGEHIMINKLIKKDELENIVLKLETNTYDRKGNPTEKHVEYNLPMKNISIQGGGSKGANIIRPFSEIYELNFDSADNN